MKAIKEQYKQGGARGAALLYPSQGRDMGTNLPPHFDCQAGGGVQGLDSGKHAAVDAQAAEDFP